MPFKLLRLETVKLKVRFGMIIKTKPSNLNDRAFPEPRNCAALALFGPEPAKLSRMARWKFIPTPKATARAAAFSYALMAALATCGEWEL